MYTETMNARTERVNMRISPDALAQLREAASLEQQDLSSFVLGAAVSRARLVLIQDRIVHLNNDQALRVEQALAEDARVIPELSDLFRDSRHRG